MYQLTTLCLNFFVCKGIAFRYNVKTPNFDVAFEHVQ